MNRLYYLIAFLLTVCACTYNQAQVSDLTREESSGAMPESDYDSTRLLSVLPQQIAAVKTYIKSKGGIYSNQKAILVDMKIPSKYFRLFVIDLKTNKIISKGLCAHGSGSEIAGTDSLQFSNIPNSYMTSLGLYKIGHSYQGSFGKSYKLAGLEKSNDKAAVRAIVLHRYSCVPDEEQHYPICNSLGCAMLSEKYFEELMPIIDREPKPMILKIYY
ncbi:murein L,D-transpeptidase catalytic domain-containing protein [Fluviicola chungangensis]|uniref:Murein L,D-transpeptidase catalytic domain family protein n=1 Tax=Fluviicola chungangensis TaxID=2597671 RepID=A0A556MNL9_9FLAO|nr:murein L,D-transpeptidase catalytic domain family protein [Fluviicola chungangensis]TSJ41520.1 murein L,D-transpeptidase catalytic domain family protein [Fluviicola chungangensis]